MRRDGAAGSKKCVAVAAAASSDHAQLVGGGSAHPQHHSIVMWASSLASLRLSTLRCSLEQAPSGGPVLSVQLNRPAAFNAVSMELLHELHLVLSLCEHPKSMLEALPADFPRVIVLR